MNALFVACILLGCAWSAQSACTYPNGENWNGGVLDDDGNYILGNTTHTKDPKTAENLHFHKLFSIFLRLRFGLGRCFKQC